MSIAEYDRKPLQHPFIVMTYETWELYVYDVLQVNDNVTNSSIVSDDLVRMVLVLQTLLSLEKPIDLSYPISFRQCLPYNR